jgi:hypothetical protein
VRALAYFATALIGFYSEGKAVAVYLGQFSVGDNSGPNIRRGQVPHVDFIPY